MLETVLEKKKSEILIITPLRQGDEVSEWTRRSVKNNKTPFCWYSYRGEGNVVQNFLAGVNCIDTDYKYVIKIDNDTEWEEGSLDSLYKTLKNTGKKIAFSYCGFQYRGSVNAKFPPQKWNPTLLRKNNYISSNVLFKKSVLDSVVPVTDEKYKRLLDWAYYLKLINHGYRGIISPGWFIAWSTKNSVSAGDRRDFIEKRNRVLNDFVINNIKPN